MVPALPLRGDRTILRQLGPHFRGDTERLIRKVGDVGSPLQSDEDLDPLLEQIGDARYTDISRSGMVNVDQLVRDGHEEDGVVLVGFSSYQGSVIPRPSLLDCNPESW